MSNTATTAPNVPRLLTARQCAELLAISERSVWSLTQRGQLRAVRLGRSVRYDLPDVLAFVNANKRGRSHD